MDSQEKKELKTKIKEVEAEIKRLEYQKQFLDTKQLVIKITINSLYGAFGNKQASFGDDDIASSVTLTGQAVIKKSNAILRDIVKRDIHDLSEREYNESIIYNDTDSCFFSINPYIKRGLFSIENCYDKLEEIENHLNTEINKWSRDSLLSKDSRFNFKREKICNVGMFLAKKRYVLNIVDDEGIKCNKFKYVGMNIVRSTFPAKIKEQGKKLIETMLMTKSRSETNKVLNEVYESFKKLSYDDLSFVVGIKGYEQWCRHNKGFETKKKTPVHVKAAYYYNTLKRELGISNFYEDICSGEKIRYFYVKPRNKYGIQVIGYKGDFPKEFESLFEVDYEKMFEKILFSSFESYYDAVNWPIRKPADNVRTDLFDFFKEDS